MPSYHRLMQFDWTHVPAINVDLHARVWSGPTDQPPLVLVAGMGMAGKYWTPMAERLANRYTLLAPDLPGFGRTKRDRRLAWPSGPSARQQADHLVAWLDAKQLGRVTLVGHSTGCHTCADLAVRFPDRVHRLVLAGPAFDPRHRTIPEQLARLAWAAAYEKFSLFPIVTVDYFRAGIPRIIQQGVRVMRVPLEDTLPSVAMPTLVIGGGRDPLATATWCRTVAGLLPQGELTMIDHAGHAMQHCCPAATAEAIARFLTPL
jgi:pimeloyl-ACP methyl ester carboxylesterase